MVSKTTDIKRNIYFKLIHAFKGVKRNKVLFISFSGRSYSDNPRAISEMLHEIRPDIEIVWAFQDPQKKSQVVPNYVRIVDKTRWKDYCKEVATAKVMVNNSDYRVPKGKGQYFIQTFHGDRAFKKVLYDSPTFRKRVLKESIKGYCDLALAGSQYGVNMYRSAFKYEGEILNCGTPRDDVLIHPSEGSIRKIKNEIGIREGTKILLYAPTFRDRFRGEEGRQKIQDININETLNQLEKKYKCQWICLMRAHPGMTELIGYEESEKIIQVSDYDDMADLLLISDMLITDYSSSAGDFVLQNRPLVLFQSDRQEYLEQDRPFYFDINESPYMVATNQEELNRLISRFDDNTIENNCHDILRFYGSTESGEASLAVVKRIIDWVDNG